MRIDLWYFLNFLRMRRTLDLSGRMSPIFTSLHMCKSYFLRIYTPTSLKRTIAELRMSPFVSLVRCIRVLHASQLSQLGLGHQLLGNKGGDIL